MSDVTRIPTLLTGVEILAIGMGALALIGVLLAFFLIRSLVRLFQEMRHAIPVKLIRDLTADIESGELMRRAQEPVSLSAMERIYGPMIQRDFPELNLEELKQRAERLTYTTLTAIDQENPTALSESPELYRTQVRQYLDSLASAGVHERFTDITLHRIVLSNYKKQAGTCRISFQIAVGAEYQKTSRDQQILAGGDSKTQFLFEIEALYVQDGDSLDSNAAESLAFNCPNCGAPVSGLGDLQCQYCGSSIEPVNIKVWTFASFQADLH